MSFNPNLLTAHEYAAQCPVKPTALPGQRVSALVRQRFTLRGRIESVYPTPSEVRAYVQWNDGTHGSWPIEILRAERTT